MKHLVKGHYLEWYLPIIHRGLFQVGLYLKYLVLLAAVFVVPGIIRAQSADTSWQEPLNLSQSGVAVDPLLIVSTTRDFHVLWRDPFLGYVYTLLEDNSWRAPVPVSVPFTEPAFASPQAENFNGFYRPTLVTDENGLLHAFWRNNRGALLYSQIALNTLASGNSWSAVQQIAESAVAWSAAIDKDGGLHLGYVRTARSEGFPTGIYYRFSENGGSSWQTAEVVYSSDYLRPLTADQAHVQIAVTDGSIGLVWDNPLINQVLFSRADLGDETSWSSPVVVDGRKEADDPNSSGPNRIIINGEAGNFHLMWHAQRQPTKCILYHQFSNDAGRTWAQPEVVFEGPTCAADYQWVSGAMQPQILLFRIGQSSFLLAWDGTSWSQAQLQTVLTEINDPLTFRQFPLGCLQAALSPSNQLVVLSCTSGHLADIWWFVSELVDPASWFDEEAKTWESPIAIAETTDRVEGAAFVIDSTNRFHLFWLQTAPDSRINDPQTPRSIIYYTYWTGDNWSRAVPLIQLPEKVDQFSAELAPDGRLSAIWRNPVTKSFFVSQVDVDKAWLPADWSTPQMFSSNGMISSPHLTAVQIGTENIIYAVPINDGRGIYLINRTDTGSIWSQPIGVLDAVSIGWDMVDNPKMVRTTNGELHVVLTRFAFLPDAVPVGLYYVSSKDGGESWSEPVAIAEGQIAYSHIVSLAENSILVTWQEVSASHTVLRYRYSYDSGLTWEAPASLTSTDVLYGASTLFPNAANQVHWLQAVIGRDERMYLREWLSRGEGWDLAGSLLLDQSINNTKISTTLAASITNNGRLVAFYAISETTPEQADPVTRLFLAEREHSLPPEILLPSPAAVQEVETIPTIEFVPTPVASATIETEALPTPDLNFSDEPVVLPSANTTIYNILTGIVPAALIIFLISGLSVWVTRMGRR